MIRERQTYIDVLRMTCMICVISFIYLVGWMIFFVIHS